MTIVELSDQRTGEKAERRSVRRLLLVFSVLSFLAILGLPFDPLLALVIFALAEVLFLTLYLRLRRRQPRAEARATPEASP